MKKEVVLGLFLSCYIILLIGIYKKHHYPIPRATTPIMAYYPDSNSNITISTVACINNNSWTTVTVPPNGVPYTNNWGWVGTEPSYSWDLNTGKCTGKDCK